MFSLCLHGFSPASPHSPETFVTLNCNIDVNVSLNSCLSLCAIVIALRLTGDVPVADY